MIKKIYIALVSAAIVLVACLAVYAVRKWRSSPEVEHVTLTPARISEIRSMVELSTVEIYEELPLKGRIGTRHLVARVAMEGTVSFDLDSLRVSEQGDTITVTLPPEKVVMRESTRPGSYKVIDVWNDNAFGPSQFTTSEENALKRRFMESARRGVYRKGYVREARQRAARSVARLLSSSTGRPVRVILSASRNAN